MPENYDCIIIGAGPIGLMHAKLNMMAGAGMIMMNDLLEERLKLCASTSFQSPAGTTDAPIYCHFSRKMTA